MAFILEIRDFVGLRFISEINEPLLDSLEEHCQTIFSGDTLTIHSDNCLKAHNPELHLNFLTGSSPSLKVSLPSNSHSAPTEHLHSQSITCYRSCTIPGTEYTGLNKILILKINFYSLITNIFRMMRIYK